MYNNYYTKLIDSYYVKQAFYNFIHIYIIVYKITMYMYDNYYVQLINNYYMKYAI